MLSLHARTRILQVMKGFEQGSYIPESAAAFTHTTPEVGSLQLCPALLGDARRFPAEVAMRRGLS